MYHIIYYFYCTIWHYLHPVQQTRSKIRHHRPLVDASPLLTLQGHHIAFAHWHHWQQKRAGELFVAAKKSAREKREMAVSLSKTLLHKLKRINP